jgi:hypothetical protein
MVVLKPEDFSERPCATLVSANPAIQILYIHRSPPLKFLRVKAEESFKIKVLGSRR